AGHALLVELGTAAVSLPFAFGGFSLAHESGRTRSGSWRTSPFFQPIFICDFSVATVSSLQPSSGFTFVSAAKILRDVASLMASKQGAASASVASAHTAKNRRSVENRTGGIVAHPIALDRVNVPALGWFTMHREAEQSDGAGAR